MLDSGKPARAQDDILKLDNQLCFGLYAATHAITRAYRPLLNELGITYSQFLVLVVLWEQDNQTVTSLGASLFLDSGTLSPVLKRLEASGFITKTRQSRDERVVEVMLTRNGRDLQERARAVCQKVRCRIGLPDPDLALMRRDLDRLLGALNENAPSAKSTDGATE